MSGPAELLALRLALIGVLFLFVLVTAMTMRSGLRTAAAPLRRPISPRPGGPRLVLVSPGETGLDPGSEFAVAGRMTLGRDITNGIVLGDSSVSSQHARIERTRDGWRIVDLGSTNGTFVNGRGVDQRGFILRGGEQLSVGAITLRFSV